MQLSSQLKALRPRLMEQVFVDKLNQAPAVELVGLRYSGKTTLASFYGASNHLALHNKQFNFAELLAAKAPRMIDEWLLQPALKEVLPSMLQQLPHNPTGQFILTSSALQENAVPCAVQVRLRPLSLFESGLSNGTVSLRSLCAGEPLAAVSGPQITATTLAEYCVRGGLPQMHNLEVKRASKLVKELLQNILDNDLYDFGSKNFNARKVRLLLRSIARNLGQSVSNSALKKDIKHSDGGDVEDVTIASYSEAFERVFLLDNQDPFKLIPECKLRIKKAVRRHFADPSFACALLNLTPERLVSSPQSLERMFDSLCVRDLKIYAAALGGEVRHYFDYQNSRIDAVIDLPDGNWCAVNFRLQPDDCLAAAHELQRINEKIKRNGGNPACACMVLCGLGHIVQPLLSNIYAVPLTQLKP